MSHSSTPPLFSSPSFGFFCNTFLSLSLLLFFFILVFNFHTLPVPLTAIHFFVSNFHLFALLSLSLSSFCLSPVNHSSRVSSCCVQTSRSLYYTDGSYRTQNYTHTHTHIFSYRIQSRAGNTFFYCTSTKISSWLTDRLSFQDIIRTKPRAGLEMLVVVAQCISA